MSEKKVKILVVDDEPNMRSLIKPFLVKQGWDVIEADSGISALDLFHTESVDLMILDIMMPGMNGWEVSSEIRKTSQVPILLLTARNETKDKVYGLSEEIGADDYLTKPFEIEELIARIKVLLRRVQPRGSEEAHEGIIQLEELWIHSDSRQVTLHDQEILFTPKEFDLLLLLAENPNKAFSRDMLLENIWGSDFFGDDRTVDQHVKNVRDKLKKAGCSFNPIQTVWGLGYKIQGKKKNEQHSY